MKKYIGVLLACAVLLIIAAGLKTLRPQYATIPTPDDSDALGMLAEPNGILVLDQRPGSEVVVSQVYLDPNGSGGFVVIHEEGSAGPAEIIGASEYLEPGEHSGIAIGLSRQAQDGEVLIAMLHGDDNSNGEFDAATDMPVSSAMVEGPGSVIMGQFMIDANAATDTPQVMF